MSLILEALKKSEAKRRLGEAPDIGTPFAMKRRRRSPLPLIVVAIVIVGALGWWFARTPPEQAAAGTSAANPPAVVAVPKAPPRAAVPATPKPAAVSPPAATKPAPTFANVDPGNGDATNPPRPAGDRPGHLASAQKPPQPAPAATPPASQAAAPVKSAAADTAAPVAAATAQQPAGQKPFPPPTDEIKSGGDAKAPAAAQKPAEPPAPMYYELAFNVRKDLPAMTVSMHVYAPDPAQRFVIINGDRYAEGDSVKDDLTLREIEPDGLLMEFRGQRFFYPRSNR